MSIRRMLYTARPVLAVIVMAAMVVSLAPRMAGAQEGQKVAQVVITGNQNLNKDTIANVVKLAPGADYTTEAVEKDKAAINAMGYFSAVSVRTEDTPEGVRVIYDVVENPQIKSVKVVGSGPIAEDVVIKLMRTQAGQVLNTATLNIDIESIQRYYKDQGYFAYVTEDIGIDRETGVLTIPMLVHTVQSIDIVGNKKTRESVFLREMKTKPGEVFNMKLLREDIGRIYNLDILEDIQTPKIEPGVDIGRVAIAIPVTEKKTGQVSVGLGYSSRSKLVGRAELAETNLRGRGQGLTLLWETGTSSSTLGSNNSYEIGYSEPWIDGKHTSLSFNVFNKLLYRFSSTFGGDDDVDGEPYNERRKGASLGISRPLTDFTRAFLTLRGESVETSDRPSNLVAPGGPGGTSTFFTQSGPVQSGTFRFLNNTRDFDSDPAAGWYRSASLELGNADVDEQEINVLNLPNLKTPDPLDVTPQVVTVPSTVKGGFRKLQFDVRHYWSKEGRKSSPTDRRATIAGRLVGGLASGSLPFFEQYFVGGGETLRGYREDRFWGDKMLVASFEYRKPIAQALSGVLFADYGDAWGSSSDIEFTDLPQHDGFNPSLGAGIGLRVNTPIGNLRLDYGMGSDGARTHFSIGHAY